MPIDTLGEAYKAHWKLHVGCPGCDLRERLDLRALLWTRGSACPLELLPERLKCPRCGGRTLRVTWETPGGAPATANPGRYWIQQLDLRGDVVETLKRDGFDAAVETWERQVQRHRGGRVIMRDGARIVRQWPERET